MNPILEDTVDQYADRIAVATTIAWDSSLLVSYQAAVVTSAHAEEHLRLQLLSCKHENSRTFQC
jgi:hypothetical protein